MIEQLRHAGDGPGRLFQRRLALKIARFPALNNDLSDHLVDAFPESTDGFPILFERNQDHLVDLSLLAQYLPRNGF